MFLLVKKKTGGRYWCVTHCELVRSIAPSRDTHHQPTPERKKSSLQTIKLIFHLLLMVSLSGRATNFEFEFERERKKKLLTKDVYVPVWGNTRVIFGYTVQKR